jgi:hypothetical protein
MVVRLRQCRANCAPKNDRNATVPTNPCEKITNHSCPWVPSGGTSQPGQSGVPPPAIDAKLPCTSRVLPNPSTGEPFAVDTTVSVRSCPRRSLLWGSRAG